MPLSDDGIETLKDAYMEFTGNMEGLLDELDKVVTAEEGEDVDILDELMALIRGALDDFDEDVDEIYETEWLDEEDVDDDVDFEDELD